MLSHGRNKNKNERSTQRGYKIEGTKLVQKNDEVIENSTPTNDEKSNF